ncbi:serine/threonine-protein kinase [Nonomuraea gerenzanensis]|uniref:non-specific serine/threonine protein kinase n=1 Tax=Nonomuraea gerenzanensis TaxID=93944 RepID=A0A1M4EFS1_9ACTN|nr:serine/threonine-protein kinase [Nonomuraea gerenzanensis]UBU09237.1 serine/threonine protein kinase [Nonomuraea gerenzanensis]SBO97634.1 serine/threonine protein kinase [Nonomuraea gerenzanensis]
MAQGGAGASLGSRYVLLDEIGGGAMGAVWRARQRDTGEIVAVKLLRDGLAGDSDLVLRFVQERNVMRALRHPHIVTVRDFVIEGERLALVMDLVEGGDLRGLLRQRGTLPPEEAARLMAQVADALAAAHTIGVVHRDVKPGNVLIDGATGQARLTDFGVARIVHGPGLTQTSAVIGTPAYLAPEVADGAAAGPAVDVYAVGLILYELLAGRPPFVGDHPMALLRQHATATPRRLPGMPDPLWALIQACAAKDPAGRPGAYAVAAALREAAPSLAGLPALPPVPRDEAVSTTSEPLAAANPPSPPPSPLTPPPHNGAPIPPPHSQPPAPPASSAPPHDQPHTLPPVAPSGEDTQTSARRGRSRQRLLIAASATAALAVAAAVAVSGPWRTPDAGAAPAPSTPPAGEAANLSVITPTPATTTPSAKPLAKRKIPQEQPTTEPPTTPPPSTTPPTRRVRTPKPRQTSPQVDKPVEEDEKPPSQEPAPSWQCRPWIATGGGAEMSPCMAVVGDTLHLKGQVRGSVRSDVHVQLYDTDADRNLSQPFLCTGLTPPAGGGVATCGPFEVTAPRTGAKTDVRQRWRATGGTTWGGGAESPWVRW